MIFEPNNIYNVHSRYKEGLQNEQVEDLSGRQEKSVKSSVRTISYYWQRMQTTWEKCCKGSQIS